MDSVGAPVDCSAGAGASKPPDDALARAGKGDKVLDCGTKVEPPAGAFAPFPATSTLPNLSGADSAFCGSEEEDAFDSPSKFWLKARLFTTDFDTSALDSTSNLEGNTPSFASTKSVF